ncbi:hypothetical protein [uncultured Methylobacterium sp.]|uniref:hypothetical protein n=1 Tax=uncultured Methylobacterium sp. TaxID=157278 RepID=UPI0035CB75B5
MPRDNTGTYAAPAGTTAIPGAVITADEFNNFVTDIGAEVTASARESEMRDLGAVATTAGTGAAYTLQLTTPWPALFDGMVVAFRAHAANTGPCTLWVNGITTTGSVGGPSTAAPLRAQTGVELSTADLAAKGVFATVYKGASFQASPTGTLTANSNQVTSLSSTVGLAVGQSFGAGIPGVPASTTITGITGSTVTLSAPFAGTTTVGAALTIAGPEWLIVNGSLAATATKLASASSLVPVELYANALASPNDLTAATWNTIANATAIANAAVAPDGTGTASQVTATGTNGGRQQAVVTTAETWMLFGYLKRAAVTFQGTLTNTSAVISNVSSIAGLAVGQRIDCIATGFPTGATITAVSGTNVTISANYTGTTSSAYSFATGGAGIVQVTADGISFIAVSLSATEWTRFETTAVCVSGTSNPGLRIVTQGDAVQAWGFGFDKASYTVQASDRGKLLGCSGAKTLILLPASTGNGFAFYLANRTAPGLATQARISVSRAGTDTVDGLTAYVSYPGEVRQFFADGATKWASTLLRAGAYTFLASDNFVWPPGIASLIADGVAPGGGGGRPNGFGNGGAGGGGGGARYSRLLTLRAPGTVTPALIGARGLGALTNNTAGTDAGNITFADFFLEGGKGGTTLGGGNGGSVQAPGNVVTNGTGWQAGGSTAENGGAAGGSGAGGPSNTPGNSSILGGPGGGAGGANNTFNGAAGGTSGSAAPGGGGAAGVTGTPQAANGDDGADGANGTPGTGGGGGGGSDTYGGRGGTGGNPGAGGGGGGAGITYGGRGGNGGRGELRISMAS